MSESVDGQPVSSARGFDAPRVLIVDDNRSVTRALSVLMNRAGFDTVPCLCGSDAIAYADREAAPAAAVVDIHLPDINGLILAQKLRDTFGPETPIIIVSGDTSMETIKSLPHVGATYFFPKPVNSSALVERLRELVTTQRMTG
ncbi:MAG TPA: response regulator [Tepidisphaeraceae bacterium]|nr:response regulator [Tepidisphaeraceae bacterium]